ncbi:expressed protein [Phakopsora pachyrhizi]|uniref:Expressed protein n=1 Tax=Phakopsora pachyrhizi TaxID=170000 RepID=A0AAV0ASR2_PHAPC|nr:expressed protein [Phakopsora pachyrhizi]
MLSMTLLAWSSYLIAFSLIYSAHAFLDQAVEIAEASKNSEKSKNYLELGGKTLHDSPPQTLIENLRSEMSQPSISEPPMHADSNKPIREKEQDNELENKNLFGGSRQSPLFQQTLPNHQNNPIRDPDISYLNRNLGGHQTPYNLAAYDFASLYPNYAPQETFSGSFLGQSSLNTNLNYVGPVVIPTVYDLFLYEYDQNNLPYSQSFPNTHFSNPGHKNIGKVQDTRVYRDDSPQGGIPNITPEANRRTSDEANSQFRAEQLINSPEIILSNRKNRPKVKISKPSEKDNSEFLRKNQLRDSDKEANTDNDNEKLKQSSPADRNINNYLNLNEKKKIDDVDEKLNEQPQNGELRTNFVDKEKETKNQFVNELITNDLHSIPTGALSQNSKLDQGEKTMGFHEGKSNSKSPFGNSPLAETDGEISVKKKQQSSSASQKTSLVPHVSFSSKDQNLNVDIKINSPEVTEKVTQSGENDHKSKIISQNNLSVEASGTSKANLNYKSALLAPKFENIIKKKLDRISTKIEKPWAEKEKEKLQDKKKPPLYEGYIERSKCNKILNNPQQMPLKSQKSDTLESSSSNNEQSKKTKIGKIKDNISKTQLNLWKSYEQEKPQKFIQKNYNLQFTQDQAGQNLKKHEILKSSQTTSKKILIDEVQEKIGSAKNSNNVQANNNMMEKFTEDFLEHYKVEEKLKTNTPFNDKLNIFENNPFSLEGDKKKNEIQSLHREKSIPGYLEGNQLAKNLGIKETKQSNKNELSEVQSKKSQNNKNKKIKKPYNSEIDKNKNDEEISKILDWINKPEKKIWNKQRKIFE